MLCTTASGADHDAKVSTDPITVTTPTVFNLLAQGNYTGLNGEWTIFIIY